MTATQLRALPAHQYRTILSAGVAVLALAGCHQDSSLAPKAKANNPAYFTVALDCAGSASTGQVSCAQRAAGQGHTMREALVATERAVLRSAPKTPSLVARNAAGAQAGSLTASTRDGVVIGGQGMYVNVSATNGSYDASTSVLQTSITVQNLLTQPMGTTDGVTAAATGIQIFFDELPTVTGGPGPVTVVNATGTATFTESGQPYFQYPGLLPSNATSAAQVWQFSVPSSSTTFEFRLYVATVLPDEDAGAIASLPATAFTILAAGQAGACAIRTGNHPYCWGFDTYGAVGVGAASAPILIPEGVLGVTTVQSVASGAEFACGLASGAAFCWGDNARGQIGDGTTIDRPIPTAVANGFTFTALNAGTEFVCGLAQGGTANCWGANSLGQLGDGTTNDRSSPSAGTTVGNGQTFSSIATGASHACGLDQSGAAWCWGGNVEGALGQTPDSLAHPTPVVVGTQTFTALAAGNNFTCGIGTDGHVYCWGANTYGALGDGTTTDHTTPAVVSGVANLQFITIAAGAFHVCAATNTGVTYCWGDNSGGQTGSGTDTTQDVHVPTAVDGAYAFTDLAAGFRYSCGIASGGTAYCWGDGTVGELGNGTLTSSNIPVATNLP